MFWGSVKGTGYPLNSPVSPSLPLPCVTVCHHVSTGLQHCNCWMPSKNTYGPTAGHYKRPGSLCQGVMMLYNSASQACDWSWQYSCEVTDHPPYSDNPALTIFNLFEPLIEELSSKQFAVDVMWSNCRLDTDSWHWFPSHKDTRFSAMMVQIPVIAAYMEVWCLPSAIHLSCIHGSRTTVLGIRVFVNLFFFKFFCVMRTST
jgi:hypothetical protein